MVFKCAICLALTFVLQSCLSVNLKSDRHASHFCYDDVPKKLEREGSCEDRLKWISEGYSDIYLTERNICLYVKNVTEKMERCCNGWQGEQCNEPVCSKQCKNGGFCEFPEECNCMETSFCGSHCQYNSHDHGELGLCHHDEFCISSFPSNSSELMTADECCFLRGSGSFRTCKAHSCISCKNIKLPSTSFNPPYKELLSANVYCSGSGNDYFLTFDGLEYYQKTCCEQVLFKDENRLVSMKAIDCDKSPYHKEFLFRADLERTVQGRVDTVMVNNKEIDIGLKGYVDGALKITRFGEYILVKYGTLTLGWNLYGLWFIQLEEFKEPIDSTRISGMCGNFDNCATNDLAVQGKNLTVKEFVDRWSLNSQECPVREDYEDECGNNEALKLQAIQKCLVIKTYPFSKCHTKINSKTFYARCINELCKTFNLGSEQASEETLCKILSEYGSECTAQSVYFDWRSPSLCPRECASSRMRYTESASSCSPSCSKMEFASCAGSVRYAGCECLPGMLMEDNECYLPKECPCKFRDKTYQAGETIYKDCNQCVCSYGSWVCDKEECPKTCSIFGLSHIHTFDSFFYSLAVPECDYTLVETRGVYLNGASHLKITIRTSQVTDGNSSYTMPVQVTATILGKEKTVAVLDFRSSYVTMKVDHTDVSMAASNSLPLKIKENIEAYISVEGVAVFQGEEFQIRVAPGGTVIIKLSTKYFSKINGLCGNWNHLLDDELTSKTGIIETSFNFALSFSNCQQQMLSQNTIISDPCKESYGSATKTQIQEKCEYLNSQEILGNECVNADHTIDFYGSCVKDFCVSSDPGYRTLLLPKIASLCYYITVKAMHCEELLIQTNLKDHQETFKKICPPETVYNCPFKGSVYSACAPFIRTCKQLGSTAFQKFQKFGSTCLPGCSCPDGYYLDEHLRECVKVEDCSCYDPDSGFPHEVGSVLYKNCQKCTCKMGQWDCHTPEKQTKCPLGQIWYKQLPNFNTSCDNIDNFWSDEVKCDVCGCPKGLLLSQGQCVTLNNCPCEYGGKLYNAQESVYTRSQKCTCIDRNWVCEDKENYKASCSVHGDIYYSGFDGIQRTQAAMRACEFFMVMTKTQQLDDETCFPINIQVKNLPCGATGITCNKVFTMTFSHRNISLMRGRQPILDGVELDLTSGHFINSYLSVVSNELLTMVIFSNGINILYDGATTIYISLPPCYKNKIDGLCGPFGERSIDSVGLVGTSSIWKVDSYCPDPVNFNLLQCEGDSKKLSWAASTCSIIAKGEAFSECRKVLDYQDYYEHCVSAACSCEVGKDCECTCTSVYNFAKACSQLGVCTKWRSQHFCPVMCPSGQSYEPCGNIFNQNCVPPNVLTHQLDDFNEHESSYDALQEGCYCPKGTFKNSNGECVSLKECDCTYENQTFQAGSSVEIGCLKCMCEDGALNCDESSCNKCGNNEIQCHIDNTLQCLSSEFICDNIADCDMLEDEQDCDMKCLFGMVECGNSSVCVSTNNICDGNRDCPNNWDEEACGECPKFQKKCELSSACIPQKFVCDGNVDCSAYNKQDMSDEENCDIPQNLEIRKIIDLTTKELTTEKRTTPKYIDLTTAFETTEDLLDLTTKAQTTTQPLPDNILDLTTTQQITIQPTEPVTFIDLTTAFETTEVLLDLTTNAQTTTQPLPDNILDLTTTQKQTTIQPTEPVTFIDLTTAFETTEELLDLTTKAQTTTQPLPDNILDLTTTQKQTTIQPTEPVTFIDLTTASETTEELLDLTTKAQTTTQPLPDNILDLTTTPKQTTEPVTLLDLTTVHNIENIFDMTTTLKQETVRPTEPVTYVDLTTVYKTPNTCIEEKIDRSEYLFSVKNLEVNLPIEANEVTTVVTIQFYSSIRLTKFQLLFVNADNFNLSINNATQPFRSRHNYQYSVVYGLIDVETNTIQLKFNAIDAGSSLLQVNLWACKYNSTEKTYVFSDSKDIKRPAQCQIEGKLNGKEWNLGFINFDEYNGFTQLLEQVYPGDKVEENVTVIFDCQSCICQNGEFNCKGLSGTYRKDPFTCGLVNCSKGIEVASNDRCNCPKGEESLQEPPNCECLCGPTKQDSKEEVLPITIYKRPKCHMQPVNITIYQETLSLLGCTDNRVNLEVNECAGECESGSRNISIKKTSGDQLMFDTKSKCQCCTGTGPMQTVNKIIKCENKEVEVVVEEFSKCACQTESCQ